MSQNVPLVTYVIPSFNYARYLPETIESVLNQDWDRLELIIVDDASTDDSCEVILKYANDYPVIKPVFVARNAGQANSQRIAIEQATGEYVCILGADDACYPHRTKQSVSFLQTNPDIAAVCSRVDVIDSNGQLVPNASTPFNTYAGSNISLDLLGGNFLCAPSVTIRAEIAKRYLVNPALRSTEDFDLWLRISDEHRIALSDERWVKYRIHGANLSIQDSKNLPASAAYETVADIVAAVSRRSSAEMLPKLFGAASEASVKHLLAQHCIAIDRHYIGRPLLGTAKAFELILDAVRLDPGNDAIRQTMNYVLHLLGDSERACGAGRITFAQWQQRLPGFTEVPLELRPEAERCVLGVLPKGIHSLYGKLRKEIGFLNWFRDQMADATTQAFPSGMQGMDGTRMCVIIDAGAKQETGGLAATLQSVIEQSIAPDVLVITQAESRPDLPGSVRHATGSGPTSEILRKASKADQWLVVLKPGDLMAQEACARILAFADTHEACSLLYADETQLDDNGAPSAPQLKPDFDIDHLRSRPYLGRFLVMRRTEFLELGGLDDSLQAEVHHDYAFRFFERFGAGAIGHLSHLLFHGRQHTPATPAALQAVLEAHLRRSGIEASVDPGLLPDSLRVRYRHAGAPMVSIIIPTKNQQAMLARCIETLTSQTTYTNYELLIVDNQSDEADARAYISGIEGLGLPQLRVLHYDHPFNYSTVNNFAAREARGEYLVLLNNDTAILDGSWLEALLNHAQRPEVGIVGAKLLFPDGRIQHGGVILGLRGPADHPFIGEPMNATGYGGRLMLDQQYSAVTAACLMIRKSIYDEVGGLDEEAFKVSYNDVDLCLKVRTEGYSVVWTPYAQLMHVANVSQKAEDPAKQEAKQARFASEQREMYRRWMPWIKADPAYNSNLRLKGTGFELESNPVFRPAPQGLKKLLAHNGDIWGSGLYRMIAPATVLAEEGLIAGGCYSDYFMPAEVAKIDPDVIVLQRQTSDTQIAGAADYRSYSRAKLIFELDDYLPNVPVSNMHKKNLPVDLVRRLRKAMGICDRIVVSTEPLREAMLPFHDHIVVLPNYLPKKLWGSIPERAAPDFTRKPRVGWAGGSSHTGDLRMIADVVRALADRVDWIFFGMKPDGIDDCIAEFHPGVHLGQYPAKLASLDLDLALAPLEDNFFNECKSNLRLLEFGICGYPVIATDLEPYRCGFPVTLVGNRFRDWVSLIEDKLADRAALYDEGIALQRFVRENWMLEGERLLQWRAGWLLNPAT